MDNASSSMPNAGKRLAWLGVGGPQCQQRLTMGEEICLNPNGYADDFVFTTDFDSSKVAGLTISSITFTSPQSIGFYGPYGVVSGLTSGLSPSDVDFGSTSAVIVNLATSSFVVGDQLTVYFAGQPNFASSPFVIGTMTASVGGSSLSTPVILPTPEPPDRTLLGKWIRVSCCLIPTCKDSQGGTV